MLRVSRLTDYATLVMTCLADQPGSVVSAAQVAESTRLEAPTVSKLLKLLGHAGLVDSFRGVAGGYRLARAADSISVADVVEAVEGPIGMTDCGIGNCDRESHCSVRGNWQRINAAVAAALRSVSIAEMAAPPPAVVSVPVAAVRRANSRT
ncbi:MAG TPA: SUF system Fe-S cluster assembly regulator [Rhodanobacteraceae bacterium]|nr:SUF system Fe-S cluster assembly regulator [Rhodanobacteraceae bacterium]